MTDEFNGVTIVLPCRNESAALSQCIKEIHASLIGWHVPYRLLVVDNNSTDNCGNIARSLGSEVILESEQGYGNALRRGIFSAESKLVLFLDADGSYCPKAIPNMVETLMVQDGDLLLGNRLSGSVESGAMPWLNRFVGTPILSFLIRKIHGVPTWDCNSGMRVLRVAKFDRDRLTAGGMEFASQLLTECGRNGGKYIELPIRYRKDIRGEKSSHLRRWRDGWRHLKVILSLH